MKIVLSSRLSGHGGVAVYNRTLARALIDGGHDDGPALLIENAHDVLIDNVTVSGSNQPEIGVVHSVTANDDER